MLKKEVFSYLDIEAKGVKDWQKKILTTFGENVKRLYCSQ
jgi:hypothetical protein